MALTTDERNNLQVRELLVRLVETQQELLQSISVNVAGLQNTFDNIIPTVYNPTLLEGSQHRWNTQTKRWEIFDSSAIPTANGTYLKGSIYRNTNPVAGGYIGWVCTQSGTIGSFTSGCTYGHDDYTATFTTVTGLKVGEYLQFGSGGVIKKITQISNLIVTFDSYFVDNSVSGTDSASYAAPIFKGYGLIQS